MLIERKWKPALDEKTLKRKIKAEEKMTIRELKKDTFILQQEKQRVKTLRVQKNRKAVFRGGNAPKDEVWCLLYLIKMLIKNFKIPNLSEEGQRKSLGSRRRQFTEARSSSEVQYVVPTKTEAGIKIRLSSWGRIS